MGVLSELLAPLGPLAKELSKLSTPVQIAVGFVSFVVLSVVINVLQQLLFKDKSKPPMVFHYFPFFGSVVVYGMEPYAFFAANQAKVRRRAFFYPRELCIDIGDSMVMSLPTSCLESM